MEPQIQYATSDDGVRIAYATTGQGPPLLLSQTWGSNLELLWSRPGSELWASVNRRLVRYDRRGTGSSQREVSDLAIQAQVADIQAVADALEINRFDLVGHVDAAAASAAFTARYPERVASLILVAPYSHGDQIGGLDKARGLIELARTNWDLCRRALADVVYPRGPTEDQIWFADLLKHSMSPQIAREYLTFQATLDVRDILPKVQVASLVIHRRNDWRSPVSAGKSVAALLPDSRFVSPGSAEEARRSVVEFLTECSAQVDDSPDESLPSGTAIILFADIVESTALTEKLGDRAFRQKARELDEALRSIIRKVDGTPVEGKLLGDGVLSVFKSAKNAIDAALRFGKAGESVGLQLHLGIHAGDVIREGDNVFGGAVNIAARISGESEAGELLVSQTVRDLARTSAGVSFEDRGEHELKGIEEPVRLYAIRGSD